MKNKSFNKLKQKLNAKFTQYRQNILKSYAEFTNRPIFWDYSINGDDYDQKDFFLLSSAEFQAEKDWEDYCSSEGGYRNGEVVLADVTYIEYFYDKNGNPVIIKTVEDCVEYEHYHGDYAEHFSQRDYL